MERSVGEVSASILEFYNAAPETSRRYFLEHILEDLQSAREGEGRVRRSVRTRVSYSRLGDFGPEAVFLLATTVAGLWAAGRWLNPASDPGFSWSLLYRLRDGERLYRDIFFAYTPLSPYLLAGASRLGGLSARFVLLINWIPAMVAGLLLLRCGRPLLTVLERFALVGVLLSASLFAPGDSRLVMPYYPGVVHALLFSLVALLFLQKDDGAFGWRALPAGLLAGLAFCCKQEVGLAGRPLAT